MQDAFEAAFSLDSAGDGQRALRLYGTGIAAAEDGIALQIATSGLGSRFFTVDAKKGQLAEWRDAATERSMRPPHVVLFCKPCLLLSYLAYLAHYTTHCTRQYADQPQPKDARAQAGHSGALLARGAPAQANVPRRCGGLH